ncbi:putative pentatricopeptide repeat-containing protein [Tanacetum coccineum]
MVSQPDVVTYNSLVYGLCKIRRWTKATLMLKEMLDKEISPAVETFNVLINAFCIEGRLQVARHVIYMMHERGTKGVVDRNRDEIGSSSDEIWENDDMTVKDVFKNQDNSMNEVVNPNVSDDQTHDNDDNVFGDSIDNVPKTPISSNEVNNGSTESNKASYAKIVKNQGFIENNKLDNKLNFKPTVISENGDEFVGFDEEL